MILIANLLSIAAAAAGGALIGIVIKLNGVRAAALMGAAAMTIYHLAPKSRHHVDADTSTVYVTTSTFLAAQHIARHVRPASG